MYEFIFISLILISLNIGEAVYEALYDKGEKAKSGIVEFLIKTFYVLAVIALLCPDKMGPEDRLIANDPVRLIIAFLSLRYTLFDFAYNLFRDIRPLWKLGTTKLFDRFFNWFFGWSKFHQGHFLVWSRFLSFLLGLGMIYQIYLT
ncbi:MAG TPA: hypothetical protein VMW50_12885 [Dehalococcoidia bacterium]|nr:hypothetical protein [Dehalococcoidia bacterium]